MKAAEFDQLFDDDQDVSAHLDWNTARRPGLKTRRVNIDYTDHHQTSDQGLDREDDQAV